MMKLLIVSITYHTSQNRVGDTITHVTLNNINCAVLHKSASTRECPPTIAHAKVERFFVEIEE